MLQQNWIANAWENALQYISTFNVNNNITNDLAQTWKNTAWENAYNADYTYDNDNKLTTVLDKIWSNNTWVNSGKYTNTYDGKNNLTNVFSETWDNTAWKKSFNTIYSYDSNNNQTSVLDQSWDDTNWLNRAQSTYTYDSNNFKTSYIFRNGWNATQSNWERSDSTHYYFHTKNTGVNDLNLTGTSLTIYPNPFTSYATIVFSAEQKNSTLKIIDLLGKEVKTITTINGKQLQLEREEIKPGIYLMRIISENRIITNQKIIIH